MKTSIKAIALTVVLSSLAGCATTPPKPAFQMTDAELCTEYGYNVAAGNSDRVAELTAEGDSRLSNKTMTLPQTTCQALAQTGGNRVAQEHAEAIERQAAANAMMQYGQQLMQQGAQQDAYANQRAQQQMYQQQQQLQQSMQAQQQSRDLQGIANAIRGY